MRPELNIFYECYGTVGHLPGGESRHGEHSPAENGKTNVISLNS
jgi:hypothetical protein